MKNLLLLAFTLTFSMLANAGHHAEGESMDYADPKTVVTEHTQLLVRETLTLGPPCMQMTSNSQYSVSYHNLAYLLAPKRSLKMSSRRSQSTGLHSKSRQSA